MKVLIFIAHCDDESLGTGGTIPRLIEAGHEVRLVVASDGLLTARGDQPDNSNHLKQACKVLGLSDFRFLDLPDQKFELVPISDIINQARHATTDFDFDLIITHSRNDLNKDHRIIHDAALVLGRPRAKKVSLLGCEIPASGAWNGTPFQPQFYVDITDTLAKKLEAFGTYGSEVKVFPDPFSIQGLEIMAANRGMESGCKAAEAFEVYRFYPEHGF